MNELHLHQLWKSKRLPFHLLTTTNQKSITIVEFGEYNTDSGPDFFNGQIEIDGIRLAGNIEMHLKSSDWYAHGHQNDKAYDNVILHVVYRHDKPVFIDGKELLTLELGDLVFWLGNKLPEFAASKIICGDELPTSSYFFNQLDVVLRERLERKSQRYFSNKYQVQTFFEAFVESFGKKVNAIPFLSLAQNIRIELLLRSSPLQRQSIVLGMSGMKHFEQVYEGWQQEWRFLKVCHDLHEMDTVAWKTKGNRPVSFPAKRIAQLAKVIPKMDWLYPFWEDSDNEIIGYWKEKLHATGENFSEEFVCHILINAVVPYVYFQGKQRGNQRMMEKAFSLLKKIRPEQNSIISQYKKLGVKVDNAYCTQTLLEQYRNWCAAKKCLSCEVGKNVLSTGD